MCIFCTFRLTGFADFFQVSQGKMRNCGWLAHEKPASADEAGAGENMQMARRLLASGFSFQAVQIIGIGLEHFPALVQVRARAKLVVGGADFVFIDMRQLVFYPFGFAI